MVTYDGRYDGPVEQHPATAQLRAYIAALEQMPETAERDAALQHSRRQLARFEDGLRFHRLRARGRR